MIKNVEMYIYYCEIITFVSGGFELICIFNAILFPLQLYIE